jgi:hypothetical protein
MVIGLDLDDPAADPVKQQRHPDQVGRHLVHASSEKSPGQSLRHFGYRSGAIVAARPQLVNHELMTEP